MYNIDSIFGEGSQIRRFCLRRKAHKSQLLAGEGSQIPLFDSERLAGGGPQITKNWRDKTKSLAKSPSKRNVI